MPHPHKGPCRVLYVGDYQGDSDHPAHQHPDWEVVYQRTGHIRTQQGNDVYAMQPGMAIIHPPGIDHADFADAPYTLFYVLIEAPLDMPWPRVCADSYNQVIGRTCETLWREWRTYNLGHWEMINLLVQTLDLTLQRAHESAHHSSAERCVAMAQRLLAERMEDAPSIGELAAEIGISRSTLHSHFMAIAGQTPQEYLLKLKLDHAIQMLRDTDMKVETIARCCGFYSASHLSRHIKALTGDSPGRLRGQGSLHHSMIELL